MEVVFYICIILIVVFLIYQFYYIEEQSNYIYTTLNNDNDVNKANSYLKAVSNKYSKKPIDNYRIGGIYDHVLHEPATAQDYYLKAIEQIQFNPTDDNIFIRDRLEDRIRINFDAEQDDNRLLPDDLLELDIQLRDLGLILGGQFATGGNFLTETTHLYNSSGITQPAKIKMDSPIEEHVVWKSDSQNVHDSNINNNLSNQYSDIVRYNKANNVYIWDIQDIYDYVKHVYNPVEVEAHNVPDALKMIRHLQMKGGKITKIQADEREFLGQVFSKIQAEPDKQTKGKLLENLMLNLRESYDGGTPVCTTGRTTRILSAFAGSENLGVFKSKLQVKNEIFLKCGALRNKNYDAASTEIKQKYDNNVEDSETAQFQEKIMNDITHMIQNDYHELATTDEKFITNIMNEVKATL